MGSVEFRTARLANGLTLIGEIRLSAMSSACGFFVKTGSRDETPGIFGVSHFLEHMMFKGTHKRSALDITYELGAIGAQSNAYTSSELTVYYGAVLPEFFERKLEILCDMLRSVLDKKEFDTEKKVILEEIALYQDRPSHVLYERAISSYFKNANPGNSVLGTQESVAEMSLDAMNAYFEQRYSPSNMVLAASGNFDWDIFVESVGNYCSTWRNFPCDDNRSCELCSHIGTKEEFHKQDLQKAYGILIAPGISAQSDCIAEANVLSCILGDSSGSKAYWQIVDKGLADCASIESYEMDRLGITMAYASSEADKLDVVLDILDSILKNPFNFTDEDLQRAKNKIRTQLVLQCESPLRRLKSIGVDWCYRNEYENLSDRLFRYDRVTRESIAAYAEKVACKEFFRATLT